VEAMARSGINVILGERIRSARKEAKMTQEKLSDLLNFKDRQTLASIEVGERKVSADELLLFMQNLGKSLDYFTDPYLIVGERIFSWRAEPAYRATDKYELKAKNLVGAFRRFSSLLGRTFNPIIPTISLTAKSSFEQTSQAGEALSLKLQLGEIPALKLQEAAEQILGIHILLIDAPEGLSGVACHLADLNLILVNRNDPSCRRNFDLAHEIFHLLTWEKNKMMPEKMDTTSYEDGKKPRVETLADVFASALLMPEALLAIQWNGGESLDIHARINKVAKYFRVSSIAAYYRMKNSGWLDKAGAIDMSLLKWNDTEPIPPLYSKYFVTMLHGVLEKGFVSVRKAAELLDAAVEDIVDLFRDYELSPPFEL
jgi:Zn-dependent peptidase ImmA (M78 family)/DNA-binding XRE family transcriptional regulator